MNSPLISFIIPAFNSAETIGLCLKSVFDQSLAKDQFEVIVVNNNSSDETVRVAEAFRSVKLIDEGKQGRSYARNTGAQHAGGKYLAFIDSDVVLDPQWAVQILKGFETSSVGGAAGPVIPAEFVGKASLNSYRKRAGTESTSGQFNLLHLTVKESPMINTAACLYLKEAFQKTGGFDPSLVRHEDIDFSKRVLLTGYDLASVPEAKAQVIFNGSGWSDYFGRTFEDGYMKQDYLLKWHHFLFKSEDGNNPSLIMMFSDEVFMNAIKGVIKGERYYFLKALNSVIKSSGRLAKILTFPSSQKYQCGIIREKAHIFENGSPLIEFNLHNKTVRRIRNKE